MSAILEKTVGQLVAESPARARVFEKHRIDYCCAGKIPLADACKRRNVDFDTVVRELEACDATEPVSNEPDWTKAPLSQLADHIVETHHQYLKDELPRLDAMTARVAKVHGDHAPEVVQIRSVFVEFRREFEEHAEKEEQILFPWIKRVESSGRANAPFPGATMANPIRCMEHEHESAGQALEQFRKLSNDYQPPMDACNTWRVLYASLETLEQDMHVHIHKENSILFPRSLALEQQSGS
ncbi:iron-sulfur cluster repair di-iron protein [Candidatus Sumerlaeota bacterium]|nr:iron-sulfur cluster repair di-iron protein [Candidatus Sumerlaeota bacterium]